MAAEDLASVLKNAIERGESLDRAAASLINAGYSQPEVNVAIQMVSQMASQPIKVTANPLPSQNTQTIQLTQRPQLQQNFNQLPKSAAKGRKLGGKGLVVTSMVVVSLLILLLVGILFAILFG